MILARKACRMLGAWVAGVMLLAAAGCVSVLPGAHGEGASRASASHLAKIRSDHGLAGLSPDGRLEEAAKRQAAYMASSGRMAHTTGWGRDFAARMKKGGIEGAAAENVAQGRMDLDRLFDMWMDSPGHRRNMLDPRFGHYGLGSAEDGRGQRYWALVLGR